ncbi:TlpA family protein disulfide reductase [Thermodesulfobacteriota bacterium]
MKKYLTMLFLIGIWILLPLGSESYAVGDPMLEAGFLSPSEKVMAPALALNSVEENRVNLEQFRGQVVLLFFWTTW